MICWRPDYEVRQERRFLVLGGRWHNNGRPVLPVDAIAEQAERARSFACSVMGADWYPRSECLTTWLAKQAEKKAQEDKQPTVHLYQEV